VGMQWDVFISHAAEDKDELARPLADALRQVGLRVWFDDFTIRVGDSIHRSIEKGLAGPEYGIVILSPYYFKKEWAQKELDAMTALERSGRGVILPVWHNMGADAIAARAPILADRRAVLSRFGLAHVVTELLRVIRPDAVEPSPPASQVTTAPMRPPAVSPGPRLLNLWTAPNGRAFASIVIGAVPEQSGPLEEEELDAGETWFRRLDPDAAPGIGDFSVVLLLAVALLVRRTPVEAA